MKRITSLSIAALAAAGIITAGIGVSQAATNTVHTNPMTALVSAIAQKFNLNPTDVQQVIDQQRTAMEQQMQAKHAEEQKTVLDQAVKDGKITQAQEDLILAKQAEMKTFMESLKNKTHAERKTAFEANKMALTQWAKDNNIPEQYLMHRGPGGRGGEQGGPGGRGMGGRGMMDGRGPGSEGPEGRGGFGRGNMMGQQN